MKCNSPNLILITTDQQRYDSVGINGNNFIQTPNLDRLATGGICFTRAYCPNTVCTPSRTSLMTGMHLSRHGAYNIGTSAVDHSTFLSSILNRFGYQTYHVGKAHFFPWGEEANPETVNVGENGTPFQNFVGFEGAEICRGHAGPHGVTGHYRKWVEDHNINIDDYRVHQLYSKDDNGNGDWELPLKFHSGNWIVERALSFLASRDISRPFYLNIGFPDPHHPHILPCDYENRVRPEQIPLTEVSEKETNPSPQVSHLQDGTINDTRFRGPFGMAGNQNTAWREYFSDRDRMKATKSYYYSMVQLIDEQIGRILNYLDESGLSNDTIVIFTSDHGEMLGDHNIGQKGPLIYEGVTKVPLFIRFPKEFTPKTVDHCVSLVDVVPTVLDLIGINDSVRRDGISLKGLLKDGQSLSREGVRIEYKEEVDRIRFKCWVTPEWKLAIYLGEEFGELYDLRQDPNEYHNLFYDSKYTHMKNKLLYELINDMERSEPVYSNRVSRV